MVRHMCALLSCGNAMAPAASLALTAFEEYEGIYYSCSTTVAYLKSSCSCQLVIRTICIGRSLLIVVSNSKEEGPSLIGGQQRSPKEHNFHLTIDHDDGCVGEEQNHCLGYRSRGFGRDD